MMFREVSTIAFIDPCNRVLLQNRRGRVSYGVSRDYSFFGGSVKDGETPRESLIREIIEKLGFDLNSWNFILFKDYHDLFNPERAYTEHVHVARLFPGRIRDLDGMGYGIIPIVAARKYRLLPLHYQILGDLEAALRDPNFSLP